eukprot:4210332-Pyramimonas_sp.AAC.1
MHCEWGSSTTHTAYLDNLRARAEDRGADATTEGPALEWISQSQTEGVKGGERARVLHRCPAPPTTTGFWRYPFDDGNQRYR